MLGAMFKAMKRGGIGPEEFAAICEAAGMDVRFSEVDRKDYRAAFGQAGNAAARAGAKVLRFSGRMKNGEQMEALVIFSGAPETVQMPAPRRELLPA